MTQRFLGLFATVLCAGVAFGQGGQVRLRWNELDSHVTGKKVAMVLPDGTALKGKVRGVAPTGLQLDISKTSNKRVQPKGLHTIPRQLVSVMQTTEYRKMGRIVCTVGALAVAGALVARAATSSSSQLEGPLAIVLPAVGVVGTAGAGVAGYFFGKAIDKRVTVIRIVPGD